MHVQMLGLFRNVEPRLTALGFIPAADVRHVLHSTVYPTRPVQAASGCAWPYPGRPNAAVPSVPARTCP